MGMCCSSLSCFMSAHFPSAFEDRSNVPENMLGLIFPIMSVAFTESMFLYFEMVLVDESTPIFDSAESFSRNLFYCYSVCRIGSIYSHLQKYGLTCLLYFQNCF